MRRSLTDISNHKIVRSFTNAAAKLGRKLWGGLRYYAKGIYEKSGDDHIFLMAAGLSFSFITCVIPLILIIFSVLGIVFEQTELEERIRGYIDQLIPYEKVAENLKDVVFSRVQEFRLYKTVAGLAGLIGLFFASSGLFGSMRTIGAPGARGGAAICQQPAGYCGYGSGFDGKNHSRVRFVCRAGIPLCSDILYHSAL